MEKRYVGAEHAFHDEDFVHGWAERFRPTAPRTALFELILGELSDALPPGGHVVELGLGPGYLAEYLLERLPGVGYTGVDFSAPMLAMAQGRLAGHRERLRPLRADLIEAGWTSRLQRPVHAVVTTWSLHDLGGEAQTAAVYAACAEALLPGGLFLNGDFIRPAGTRHDYEPGRFGIDRHLELLEEAGFGEGACLALFEEELEAPTAAQNYACLRARR
jgi:SAM-dependent methyltransferase